MQLVIVVVGYKMLVWIEIGFQEYVKCMLLECWIIFKEIKFVECFGSCMVEIVMVQECEKIEVVLFKGVCVIVLDECGCDWILVQLLQQLVQWQQDGCDVVFVIGGVDGFDFGFKVGVDMFICIFSMILLYGMVWVMLVEQFYCVWLIMQNYLYYCV